MRTGNLTTLYFVGASLLAGVINYAFQVFAAKQLTVVEFGEFSTWLARASAILFLSIQAQVFSNFRAISPRGIKILALCGFLISGVGVLSQTPMTIAFFYITSAILWGLMAGQTQSRQYFGYLATGLVLTGLGRLLTPYAKPELHFFYLSHTTQYLLPFLLFLFLPFVHYKNETPNQRAVLASLLLAIVTTYIPQADLLIIGFNYSKEVIGTMALYNLVYKAIFFSLTIFTQIILPRQIQAGLQFPSVKFSLLFLGFGVLLDVVGVFAGRYFFAHVGFDPVVLFLGSLNMILLSLLFLFLQDLTARLQFQPSIIGTTLLVFQMPLFIWLKLEIQTYLATAVIINIGLLAFIGHWSLKTRKNCPT